MASRRAANVASNCGTTNLASRYSRMPKMIRTRMISDQCGNSGLTSFSAARWIAVMGVTLELGGMLENEGERDADDGQSLGKREPEDRERLQPALHFRLTGRAVDVGREDQPDTDARTDGREAIADHVERAARRRRQYC